jgi:parallel beta-helix repeat protein
MNRKLVLALILTLLVGTLNVAFNTLPATASLPVHNIDTGLSYATIQEAINANETLNGHTILVDAGVYYENVVLNKTLSLVGENRDFTVIDANGTGNAIVMQADYSMVENFTIQNGGFGIAMIGNSTKRYVGNVVVGNIFRNNADAIGLSTCDRNVIVNNTFENNGFNIIVGWINPFATWNVTSNNNTIARNNVTQGIVGILILCSRHNVVSENNISNMTDKGIAFLSTAGYPYEPIVTNNSIYNNVIANCTFGLFMSGQASSGYEGRGTGSRNDISGNIIQHSELGLYIFDRGNNTISNNTVAYNVFGMYLDSQNNLLRANKMDNNVYNFVNMGDLFEPQYNMNDVDTSNTINGKPVYYLFDQTNLNINPSTHPDIGYLAMQNCTNVTITNMSFSNNGFGLILYESVNITIENTIIQDNLIGIYATSLANSKIQDCTLRNNLHGLRITDGEHIEVKDNVIMNNSVRRLLSRVSPYFVQSTCQRFGSSMNYLIHNELIGISSGIFFYGVVNSTATGNVISRNERGIYLHISIHNVFRNNTMTENVYNFGVDPQKLIPLDWVFSPPDPPQISPHLMNDVDTSNTVDGKPIYWWINRQDEQVPKDAGYLVLVNSTNMIINDLVLQNNSQGMLLVGVSNSSISNNSVTDTQHGIYITPHMYVNPSTNNTITQNNITRNGLGIKATSPNTLVSGNLITDNLGGIWAQADNITITENMIVRSTLPPLEVPPDFEPKISSSEIKSYYGEGVGIILEGTNSTVYKNTIQDNYYGTSVGYSSGKGGNIIYHNNFINNTEHFWQGFTGHPFMMNNNTWDNDYPSGGNYWSNYTRVDLHSGSDQDETGSDGIGDTAHIIDENNTDNYPLMGMFSDFKATSEQHVQTICNSTITDFQFNGTAIGFNISGENDTTGFCRVCIPTALMNATYTVFVNGTEVSSNLLPCSNETYSYLYFNYTHSTQEVIIIPEFPSFLVLPLFMIATLLAVIAYKRKSDSE